MLDITRASLDGRFEMSVEDFKTAPKDSVSPGEKNLGKNINNQDSADKDVAKDARSKAWETAKNAWRTK